MKCFSCRHVCVTVFANAQVFEHFMTVIWLSECFRFFFCHIRSCSFCFSHRTHTHIFSSVSSVSIPYSLQFAASSKKERKWFSSRAENPSNVFAMSVREEIYRCSHFIDPFLFGLTYASCAIFFALKFNFKLNKNENISSDNIGRHARKYTL